RVAQLSRSDRATRILNDLGTDPSVVYLQGGDRNNQGNGETTPLVNKSILRRLRPPNKRPRVNF
ncbi:MAG: hypothetical protein VX291_06005, partial [Gemmatimonadota bacterium]|nr:hypothetical protein [Gemmatimonadota bacterium]